MNTNVVQLSPDMQFLVIDDSPSTRDTIVKNLKTLGFKFVTEGLSEGDALHTMQEKAFDFVILEKDMRQMHGMELVIEIRENIEIKRAPILMIGVDPTKEELQKYPEINLDGYLRMPFVIKELTTAISQALMKFRDKDNIEIEYEMAREMYMDGEFEKALDWYKAISRKTLTSARAFVGMARCERALGNLEAAEKNIRLALQNNKNHPHAHFDLAITLLSQDKKQQALKAFDVAIQFNPRNPIRYDEAAKILTRCELYEEAESYLMRAVNQKIVYPLLYAQVGRNFLSQKKKDKALEFLQRAVDQDPNNPSFLNSIGICYKEMGKFDDAITSYNLALKQSPNDPKILYNKVLCLVANKDYDFAKKTCLQILKYDPKFEKAQLKIQEIDKLVAETKVEPKYRGVAPK